MCVCNEMKEKIKETIVTLNQNEVPEAVKNTVKNCKRFL
jgi:hypothetical protein